MKPSLLHRSSHTALGASLRASLAALLGGLVITLVLLMGYVSGALAAVPLEPDTSQQQTLPEPQQLAPVQSAVDQYLASIPADFYTLKTVAALKSALASGRTVLIDVRQPSEYRTGHIPGAINIPLRELDRHLGEIPADQDVVLYCSTGYRSAMGVMALQLQGFNRVRGFPPSLAGWQAAGEA
ncbi:rhodanese-like domain-containing protein [Cyanobium gracile]|uniref:Rhodanese-like domain-containing protein n=1 Tax=Cyanobium gracile UHCC 0281 TaxID=3110309 RepID=A0ABU5STR7_9CYAN|nr:rhodanese-like domain-containing protein [Cyanobium gracile]MEA5441813.1 rhodanese-like domain-containing protein [Cyanobium gracile UHCC 0281]